MFAARHVRLASLWRLRGGVLELTFGGGFPCHHRAPDPLAQLASIAASFERRFGQNPSAESLASGKRVPDLSKEFKAYHQRFCHPFGL